MADFLSLMILILSSACALALGVMLAYMLLRFAFARMAPRPVRQMLKTSVETAKASI